MNNFFFGIDDFIQSLTDLLAFFIAENHSLFELLQNVLFFRNLIFQIWNHFIIRFLVSLSFLTKLMIFQKTIKIIFVWKNKYVFKNYRKKYFLGCSFSFFRARTMDSCSFSIVPVEFRSNFSKSCNLLSYSSLMLLKLNANSLTCPS